jgi:AraC-like DNA-binding protein
MTSQRGPWCESIDQRLLQWLPPGEDVEAGEVLIRQDEPVSHVVVLVRGFVKVLHSDHHTPDRTIGIRLSGSTLGVSAALLNTPSRVSAATATPVRLHRLPLHEFNQLVHVHMEFATRTVEAMEQELRASINDVIRKLLPTPEQRLASLLDELAPDERPLRDSALLNVLSSGDLAGLLATDEEQAQCLLRHWQDASRLPAASAETHNEHDDERIEKAIGLIHERYHNVDLKLGLISHELNVSPSHMSRLFKRATGLRFRQFLNRVRIERARRALLDTSLSVKEIACAVGYKHVCDLTHRFRATHGASPTRYRHDARAHVPHQHSHQPESGPRKIGSYQVAVGTECLWF